MVRFIRAVFPDDEFGGLLPPLPGRLGLRDFVSRSSAIFFTVVMDPEFLPARRRTMPGGIAWDDGDAGGPPPLPPPMFP